MLDRLLPRLGGASAISGDPREDTTALGMIDLHCHLLPGIDDGAQGLAEALAMARVAVRNGIARAVLTPHIQPGRYDNDLPTIRAALAVFKAALHQRGIPLAVDAAAEVRIGPEILRLLADGELPFVGSWEGSQVLLLELPHSHIPPGSDKLVGWLMGRGVRPLIAHPERNKDVIRHLDKIVPFVRQGCLLQVTADSVAGDFGRYAHQRALELLERGWVTLLASDAHNLTSRPPRLHAGRAAAARVVGEAEAWKLVRDTPAAILGCVGNEEWGVQAVPSGAGDLPLARASGGY